jgi:Tfp pilus assembly protein PilX
MTQHFDKQSEQGFALYLAIGFIVLISLLAGSVGTRLNIASLSEARQTDRRMALDDAEASLGEAWVTLAAQFALDDGWPASASSASDSDVIADRTKCLGPHETTLTSFYASQRASNGARARRFFVKRDGSSYRLYGCGFDDKGTRAAFALYDVSGSNLSLNRLRRY